MLRKKPTLLASNILVRALLGASLFVAGGVAPGQPSEEEAAPSKCPFGFGPSTSKPKHPNDTPVREHWRKGKKGHFVLAAQITDNYKGTIVERAKEHMAEGQEHLSKADFHGPLGIFTTRITGAGCDLIGDTYNWYTTNSYFRAIPNIFFHAGRALKILRFFEDFMDRQGKVAVEVRGSEAVEHLFTLDGQYSDSLAQMMNSKPGGSNQYGSND